MCGSMPDSRLHWDAALYQRNSSFQFVLGMDAIAKLDPRPGERVLDIGCGNGALTIELASRVLPGGDVVAMDISTEMLDQARTNVAARQYKNIRLVQQDVQALKDVETFDAVFSNSSIHWIHDLETLYLRIHSALKHGGRIMVQTGLDAENALMAALHETIADPRFTPYFTNATAFQWPWRFCTVPETEGILQAAGFSSTTVEVDHRVNIFPTKEAFVNYCRAAALVPFLPFVPDKLKATFVESFMDRLLVHNGAKPLDLIMPRLYIHAKKP
jgi:trans-aconitate 2-methyltransferase